MYTSASVKKINSDGTVLVSCGQEACKGCSAQMFCSNKNNTEYSVRNDGGFSLEEGSSVELFLPPGRTILSTALVFALPLALFPVGYLLMRHFTGLNEALCALGGFGAMALAFGIGAAFNVRHKKALMPSVTKVLSPAGSGETGEE